jgi:hypothetical protein
VLLHLPQQLPLHASSACWRLRGVTAWAVAIQRQQQGRQLVAAADGQVHVSWQVWVAQPKQAGAKDCHVGWQAQAAAHLRLQARGKLRALQQALRQAACLQLPLLHQAEPQQQLQPLLWLLRLLCLLCLLCLLRLEPGNDASQHVPDHPGPP